MANQIPASYTVTVNITIQDQSAIVGDFGAFNFVGVSPVISPLDRIVQIFSAADALSQFGEMSEEYAAAVAFFAQNPNPGFMYISRWFNVASEGGYKTLYTTTQLSTLLAITDGEFNIGINGVRHDITGLDLTGATSWADIATIFETAIRAIGSGGYTLAKVQVVTGALGTYFIFYSGTTGTASTVQAIQVVSGGTGTDLTTPLHLIGGILIPGANIETPVEALVAISAINDGYYGVGFSTLVRDTTNTIDIAQYIETLPKVFGAVSNDSECLDGSSTTDMAYLLKQLDLNRTMLTYHNQAQYYPEASILSNMFSIDFSGTDTVKDADFKPLPGIPSVPLTLAQLDILIGKNANTVITQANQTYFTNGNCSSGRPFDITQDVDWLQSTIQLNALAYIVNKKPKVPYTDGGAAGIEQNVRGSLQQGVINGMLASTNLDADGNTIPPYTTSVPRVSTIPLGTRANRIGPPISFTAQASGSIRSITINGLVTV